VDLSILNQQDKIELWPELEKDLEQLARQVFSQEEVAFDPEVNLIFVDDQIIRDYNRAYRGIDQSTDVLSFAMRESLEDEPDWDDPAQGMLGDVLVSLETARRQAEDYGHSLRREVYYLVTHGLLHLLGYDHAGEEEQQIMRRQEEKALTACGFIRN